MEAELFSGFVLLDGIIWVCEQFCFIPCRNTVLVLREQKSWRCVFDVCHILVFNFLWFVISPINPRMILAPFRVIGLFSALFLLTFGSCSFSKVSSQHSKTSKPAKGGETLLMREGAAKSRRSSKLRFSHAFFPSLSWTLLSQSLLFLYTLLISLL